MAETSKITLDTVNVSEYPKLPLHEKTPSGDYDLGAIAYNGGQLQVYNGTSWQALASQTPQYIQTASLVSWLDPTQHLQGASTWGDSTSGASWSVSGTTSKPNDYQIEPASGSIHFIDGRQTAMEVGSGTLTYECWWYMSTTNYGTWKYIIGKSSFWDANSSGIYIDSPGTSIGFHTTSTNGIEYALSNISTGWKHLAAVMESNGRKLYVNGTLVASDLTRHDQTSTTNLSVGADNEGDYGDSSFKFGHARFYNVALTQSQIQQHFNAEKGYYGL